MTQKLIELESFYGRGIGNILENIVIVCKSFLWNSLLHPNACV